jgi:small GTP-binding protein
MTHNYGKNDYKNKQHQLKILIVGDSSVGKSSILLQFTHGSFSGNYLSTVGIDFKIKSIEINGKIYKLQIWDSAGQERFAAITKNYYRGAMGIIIVYDVTRRESFDMVGKWLRDVRSICDTTTSVVLVGNKIDVIDGITVTSQEGKEFAENNNIDFFECSSMSGKNVSKIFYHISDKIIQTRKLDKQKELKEELKDELKNESKESTGGNFQSKKELSEQTKLSTHDKNSKTVINVNDGNRDNSTCLIKPKKSDRKKTNCCG